MVRNPSSGSGAVGGTRAGVGRDSSRMKSWISPEGSGATAKAGVSTKGISTGSTQPVSASHEEHAQL